MKLSTKGRYAVAAMLDLAKLKTAVDIKEGEILDNHYLSLGTIAVRNNISESYLEQLFSKLKKSNLVISTKGSKGGYKLARSPESIHILDIINSVDENIEVLHCRSEKKCCLVDGNYCGSHNLWDKLDNHIQIYLSNISLTDVINNNL